MTGRTTSIEASFSGTCGECGVRYPPKTRIVMVADVGWCHEVCPESVVVGLRPGEERCLECFLFHPIGECDR